MLAQQKAIPEDAAIPEEEDEHATTTKESSDQDEHTETTEEEDMRIHLEFLQSHKIVYLELLAGRGVVRQPIFGSGGAQCYFTMLLLQNTHCIGCR